MYEATVVLHDCKPLSARISWESCAEARNKSRGFQFNNDNMGVPFLYEKCNGCLGVQGDGTKVAITAGPPKPPRVAVMTIDGRYGYV